MRKKLLESPVHPGNGSRADTSLSSRPAGNIIGIETGVCHNILLERLTQPFEHMPLELGELIAEEDAMVGAIPRPADGPSP